MNSSALVVKYAEIHLKGLNRPFFERKLVEKIEEALADVRPRVVREQGRMRRKDLGGRSHPGHPSYGCLSG